MAQHVIGLQGRRGHHFHPIQIAAGQLQIVVARPFHDQHRARIAIEPGQRGAKILGLVRTERPAIHNGKLLTGQLGRKRRAQGAQNHLLGKPVFVAARLRAVYRAALAPDRRANGTNTRAAGALLSPELAAGAGNLAATLGLVRAGTFASQIPAHRFMQQMRIHAGGKHRVSQVHLAYRLTLQIPDVNDWHGTRVLLMAYFACRDLRISR